MGAFDFYKHGSSAVICDRCGFRYHRDNLHKEWNGLRTCKGGGTNNCWEARHPQDFVKARKDKQTPPWVRPEPDDVFTTGLLIFENNGAILLDGSEFGDARLLKDD